MDVEARFLLLGWQDSGEEGFWFVIFHKQKWALHAVDQLLAALLEIKLARVEEQWVGGLPALAVV